MVRPIASLSTLAHRVEDWMASSSICRSGCMTGTEVPLKVLTEVMFIGDTEQI